jgi:phage-related protein (TIGR01555 family)
MARGKHKKDQLKNSLSELTSNIVQTAQLSQTDTMQKNNRYNYLFNNRQLLNELYIEHGLIQTLIDQPVDDAFRGGFEIKTEQLSEDEIKELQQHMETDKIYETMKSTVKWSRLFGGGGVLVMTNQDSKEPLKIDQINEYSALEFYAADLWELNMQYYQINPNEKLDNDTPYNFYGKPVHKSRVYTFKGKEAPSMRRRQFRGWGMSEVERLVRSFNQYLKNQNVIFELLDEAKVDIYKIEGFNSSIVAGQQSTIQEQIQLSNILKNFLNALVMDKDDDYEQKSQSFAGLGDMLDQVRKGIASDMRMPITKLFGVSSAGFNSGEDDIENYNAMIETEIRSKSIGFSTQIIKIVSQKLFGIIPEDLELSWKPLRILSSEQEENVKNAKSNRLISLMMAGLVDVQTAKEVINKDNLVSVDIDVNDDLFKVPELAKTSTAGDISDSSNTVPS